MQTSRVNGLTSGVFAFLVPASCLNQKGSDTRRDNTTFPVVVGEPRPHPATGRFIREEELREPLFTKDHKVRGHVDGRVINAGLAPVDHPADALRVVDEHMAHVEIAMHHHGEIWPRRIVVEPALPPVEALVVHHELASDAVNVVGHLLTGLRRCTDEHPRIHGGGNGVFSGLI